MRCRECVPSVANQVYAMHCTQRIWCDVISSDWTGWNGRKMWKAFRILSNMSHDVCHVLCAACRSVQHHLHAKHDAWRQWGLRQSMAKGLQSHMQHMVTWCYYMLLYSVLGVGAVKGPCAVFIFFLFCVLLVIGGSGGGEGGMLTFFATARFLLHFHTYVMLRYC